MMGMALCKRHLFCFSLPLFYFVLTINLAQILKASFMDNLANGNLGLLLV
jgi:hypothetical protein